jgi:steroid delta-isomerase-like uncharacterized protein
MTSERATGNSLRERREAIVRAHTASENRQDFDATIATFDRPRYEVIATSEEHAGAEAVGRFLRETARAFPDFSLTTRALHHADTVVVTETEFAGTHRGVWRGLPPTGRSICYRMCNVFMFEEDALICERLHFDVLTILRGLGIASDPTSRRGRLETALAHPVTIGRALVNAFAKKSPK